MNYGPLAKLHFMTRHSVKKHSICSYSPFSKTMLNRGFNGFRNSFPTLDSLKSITLYSTLVASKDVITTPHMVECLVKSAGFSEKEAVAIVTKVSHPLKSTKKAELVVDFLKHSGLDGTQIRKVVACFPNVLRSNVDKTLRPKIRVFQDLGFSGSDLGSFISRIPNVLHRSVESRIIPALELLKSIFGGSEELVRVLLQMRTHRLLSQDATRNFPANVKLLQSYGVTSKGIRILMRPNAILFSDTKWVEKIVKGVEEKLGIPRTSPMFVHGICALSYTSEERLQLWLDLFRNYGWSESEISKLLRKHPLCLCLSEKSLRLKLKYFMEDRCYGPDDLVKYSTVLSCSLEKRIVPRASVMQILEDRNLLKRHNSIFSAIRMTESKFFNKYVLPYKEDLPELYENYTRARGTILEPIHSET